MERQLISLLIVVLLLAMCGMVVAGWMARRAEARTNEALRLLREAQEKLREIGPW